MYLPYISQYFLDTYTVSTLLVLYCGGIQICQMFNLGFHSNGIKTDKVSSKSLDWII